MEKTLIIDGRQVTFKATAGLAYRYKAQFGREYLDDALRISESADKKNSTGLEGLTLLYDVLWCLAKAADPSIPDPQTWLDSFNVFPVLDIWQELQPICEFNLSISPKNA